MKKMIRTLISSAVILVGGALNFIVFLEAYKRLALPFINEEQRVENAPFIVFYILPIFIGLAVIIFLGHKIVFGFYNRNC
nr:hypothetical protein [uncultured Desulfobacter sp.]